MDLLSGPGQDQPDPLRVSPSISAWGRPGLSLMGLVWAELIFQGRQAGTSHNLLKRRFGAIRDRASLV